MQQENNITVQDVKEFLQMFLRPKDYALLLSNIRSRKDFYLMFKLTERIEQVQHVVVFNKNNHFAVQFIPDDVALAPMPDAIVPDVIVFVDK
jgi:hypothetical protein